MAVQVTSKYVGGLTVHNVHGPSQAELVTTAPTDNGGTGELFSPTDLVATSLGACMLTIMGLFAEKNGIDMKNSTVNVEKHMILAPRRIGKLIADFNMPRALSERDRKKLEAVAKTCPVKRSLRPEVEIILNFKYEL